MSKHPSRPYLRVLQVVYDLVYAALLLVGSPFVLLMLLISRRWRSGLIQRFGFCGKREGNRPALWIHGVSNGEILAARELVTLIEQEMPWIEVVLSSTTATGREAAARCYPDKQLFCFPIDFSFAAKRVIDRVRPSAVLLMELELWPNFLLSTFLRGVPVLLANGRMSAKSARDYKILQKIIPEPMDRVHYYCVQSKEYARRFEELGVPPERMSITGSMKFDNIQDELDPEVHARYAERLALDPDAFVLVGGSTHGVEERVLLEVYAEILARDPAARLILCPRHPERLSEVESLIRSHGFAPLRLSTLVPGGPPSDDVRAGVILVDTTGELALLYSFAGLVYVGGTLTNRGGQNMMEPAGFGKAVVVGPNTWNFRDPVELLLANGGLRQVADEAAVKAELLALHADPQAREELGRRARAVCLESKGATRRILDILKEHLPGPPPDRGRGHDS